MDEIEAEMEGMEHKISEIEDDLYNDLGSKYEQLRMREEIRNLKNLLNELKYLKERERG